MCVCTWRRVHACDERRGAFETKQACVHSTWRRNPFFFTCICFLFYLNLIETVCFPAKTVISFERPMKWRVAAAGSSFSFKWRLRLPVGFVTAWCWCESGLGRRERFLRDARKKGERALPFKCLVSWFLNILTSILSHVDSFFFLCKGAGIG
jgi:hypothetical protein